MSDLTRTYLAAALIVLGLAIVGYLAVRHVSHNRQRRRQQVDTLSLWQHIVKFRWHHVSALALVVIGVAVALGVGAATYVLPPTT